MYIAMMIGAGPLMSSTRKNSRPKIEAIVQPHHVFHGVDRHAAFANFPENTIRVAIMP